jgi:hypothetical protein
LARLTPMRAVLGIVGLGIGVAGVLALREATLSTHQPVSARETELVVSARSHGAEVSQTLPELVEAQLMTCRLEVSSDFTGPIEELGDGRFRAALAPALDKTNRRQFRGCVEDFVTDHLQINVLEISNLD